MFYVFYNDKIVEEKKACVPINDRSFLFGDGIFSTLKVVKGYVENLDKHLELMKVQCREMALEMPVLEKHWIDEIIEANHAQTGVWRLKIIISSGNGEEFYLHRGRQGILYMVLKPYLGQSYHPVKLCYFHTPVQPLLASIKSTAYLDRMYIKDFARQQNCDDAIVKGFDGIMLETAFSNLFWKIDDGIYYPSPKLPLLFGSTQRTMLEAAIQMGVKLFEVKEKQLPLEAQVYICNSMIGLCPVIEMAGLSLTRDVDFENRLFKAFQRLL